MENGKHWEYKTVKFPASGGFLSGKVDERSINIRLNELGEQGWELVTTSTTNMVYGCSRDIMCIFKREKR